MKRNPERAAACKPRGILKRDLSTQAGLFKLLADPNRLRIVATLARAGAEVCVCEFTAELRLEQPTISHHLRALREAKLVRSERRGTWAYYSLAPGALERVRATLAVAFPSMFETVPLRRVG